MKTKLVIIMLIGQWSVVSGQGVADVSDPTAIKLTTPDQGIVVSGTLGDTIKNYPKLKDNLIAETTKRLEAEPEIAAQHRAQILAGQKVDLPKATVDKHNARIAKFAKTKEDAITKAVKKAQDAVKATKIDITMSQAELDEQVKTLGDARALAVKAKATQDALTDAGIPISKETQKTVAAVQPKPNPTPVTTPTPDDGL